MNTISKSSITINDKKVLFKDIASILKWSKTLKITDINGEITDIVDEKMVKKFNEKLAEKPNFVYIDNRFINLALIKDIKQVTKPANKEFAAVVEFGGAKEVFNRESAPATDELIKKITKAINVFKSSKKEAGLTK